jgi:hypothetical protein
MKQGIVQPLNNHDKKKKIACQTLDTSQPQGHILPCYQNEVLWLWELQRLRVKVKGEPKAAGTEKRNLRLKKNF